MLANARRAATCAPRRLFTSAVGDIKGPGARATEGRFRALRVKKDVQPKSLAGAILARLYDRNTTALDCMGAQAVNAGVRGVMVANSILERGAAQPGWREGQTPVEDDTVLFVPYWVEPGEGQALLRLSLRAGKRLASSSVPADPDGLSDLRVKADVHGYTVSKVFRAVFQKEKRFRALCMGQQSLYNAVVGVAHLHNTGLLQEHLLHGSWQSGTDNAGSEVKYVALELQRISDYRLTPVYAS